MKNIVAIIQARMGSKRLPNKMMLFFQGYPVIEWVRFRVNQASLLDQVVFALPDSRKDDVLANYLTQCGEKVFRGSEDDVLKRFSEAAIEYHATDVVRVCGDNLLICPSEVDKLIRFFLRNKCDYAYNHIPKKNKYPDGLGAEIISAQTLKYINKKASLIAQREHLMNYVWDNPKEFVIKTFDPINPALFRSDIRLDLDTLDDFAMLMGYEFRIEMDSIEIMDTITAAS